jgi:serine/threonine protein kinase
LAGKYRLERYLGRGGFASVWEARNVFIERRVALKILSSTVFRIPGAVERFVREAKLAAKEIHPTVVRVEDMGQTDAGVPFLVMELLDGEPLDKILSKAPPLPVEQVVACTRPLVEGLAAAHARGIIHRDIKPGNIFLVRSGTAGPPIRILDMGIAKDLGDPSKITCTGQLVGTPRYLPPEVLLDPCAENWRPSVDVFAMGMVVFKMLTGQLPFEKKSSSGPRLKIVQQMDAYERYSSSSEELPGPSTFVSGVPVPIDSFVRNSLAIERTERFQDAGEMLAGYDEALRVCGLSTDEPTSTELVRSLLETPESETPRRDAFDTTEPARSVVEPSSSRVPTVRIEIEEPTLEDATRPLASAKHPGAHATDPLSLASLLREGDRANHNRRDSMSEPTTPDANAPTVRMQAPSESVLREHARWEGEDDTKVTVSPRRPVSWRARAIGAGILVAAAATGAGWIGMSWQRARGDPRGEIEGGGSRDPSLRSAAVLDGGATMTGAARPEADAAGPVSQSDGTPNVSPEATPYEVGADSTPPLVTVSILGLPDGASVTFDNRAIDGDQIVGPSGTSGRLVVRAPGYERHRRDLTLREGETVDLTGAMRPTSPAPKRAPSERPPSRHREPGIDRISPFQTAE